MGALLLISTKSRFLSSIFWTEHLFSVEFSPVAGMTSSLSTCQWRFWAGFYEEFEFQIGIFTGWNFINWNLISCASSFFSQTLHGKFTFCCFFRGTTFSNVPSSNLLKKPVFFVLFLSSPVTLTLGLPLLPSEKTCDFAAASGSGVAGFSSALAGQKSLIQSKDHLSRWASHSFIRNPIGMMTSTHFLSF